METSCKDNYNVADAFTSLVEMANAECKRKGIDISKRDKKNIKIEKEKVMDNQQKKGKCCLLS